MITKEMLAKCQNELGQAYQFLPDDVKSAIRANGPYVEYFDCAGHWSPCPKSVNCEERHLNSNGAYRLLVNTPVEPEQNWTDEEVYPDGLVWVVGRGSTEVLLSLAQSLRNFLGIVYEKDGKETLRTSVDAAFGIPKRVRFLK